MPLSKEAAQRAASILESIITQLEESEPVDPDEEEAVSIDVGNIQATIDVLKSPLFSALVGIKSKYAETVEKLTTLKDDMHNRPNLVKETEIKLKDNPSIIPEFRQRYGIEDIQFNTNSSSLANEATPESIKPKLACSPDLSLSHSQHTQFPTTFAIKASHITSHDMSHDSDQARGHVRTHDSTPTTSVKKSGSKQKKKKSGSGIFGGKQKSSGNVTLADLASSPILSNSGKELGDSRRDQGSGVDNFHGEVGKSLASNESSLSTSVSQPPVDTSFPQQQLHSTHQTNTDQEDLKGMVITNPSVCSGSTNVEDVHLKYSGILPAVPSDVVPAVPSTVVKAKEVVKVKEGIEDTDGRKDLLFFMRDRPSQTELQSLILEREHKPREVALVMGESVELGMDFIGTSSTGVFINKLYPGGIASGCDQLRTGDQVLRVNHQSTENMASFEVESIARGKARGDEITLTVQYNPIGMRECKRIHGSGQC